MDEQRGGMSPLLQQTLCRLREYYGASWLPAIAERWERHTPLAELLEYVDLLEGAA